MAKASRRRRPDIQEVAVEKVDSRISLESILDQLGKKGVPQAWIAQPLDQKQPQPGAIRRFFALARDGKRY
jgi:hypothetical protein